MKPCPVESVPLAEWPYTVTAATGELLYVSYDDLKLARRYPWCIVSSKKNGLGYASAVRKKRDGTREHIRLHRLIMKAQPGQVVDHINGNTFDNRRFNLRFCTQQQNTWNSRKRQIASSKFKGVHRFGLKWRVQIKIDGQMKSFGVFKSEEEAARAYDVKVKELRGEFAVLNFPESK